MLPLRLTDGSVIVLLVALSVFRVGCHANDNAFPGCCSVLLAPQGSHQEVCCEHSSQLCWGPFHARDTPLAKTSPDGLSLLSMRATLSRHSKTSGSQRAGRKLFQKVSRHMAAASRQFVNNASEANHSGGQAQNFVPQNFYNDPATDKPVTTPPKANHNGGQAQNFVPKGFYDEEETAAAPNNANHSGGVVQNWMPQGFYDDDDVEVAPASDQSKPHVDAAGHAHAGHGILPTAERPWRRRSSWGPSGMFEDETAFTLMLFDVALMLSSCLLMFAFVVQC